MPLDLDRPDDDDLDRPADAPADPLPDEPWTELGYAHRLVFVYGDRLRYVGPWRRWLVWDGTRWAPDSTGQTARWAKSIARRLMADALAETDKQERRRLLDLARRAESSHGIAGTLTLASTEAEVAITQDALDADPFLLNCHNGILDLRTGDLRAHDPADLLTKITGASFDPEAVGAEFEKFLARIQPSPSIRAFLARLLGHALEGRQVEHVLPMFLGVGANGKSTLLNAVLRALGDYAAPADPELLNARTFDAHPTGVADLFGLRLAVLHENDEGRRLAEGTVKRLTGGDRLKARRMREDFWSFEPSHTFVLLANHRPVVAGTDEGIWRRLRVVPFEEVIGPAEVDDELGDRLALEADAILAWLVEGHRAWHDHGLDDPAEVTQATLEFRHDSDALGRFLTECVVADGVRVRSSDLHQTWLGWCQREGELAALAALGTNKAFSAALQKQGFDASHSRTGTFWLGIGLADPARRDDRDGCDGLSASPPTREGEPPADPSHPSHDPTTDPRRFTR